MTENCKNKNSLKPSLEKYWFTNSSTLRGYSIAFVITQLISCILDLKFSKVFISRPWPQIVTILIEGN